jgi:hypothetical protein
MGLQTFNVYVYFSRQYLAFKPFHPNNMSSRQDSNREPVETPDVRETDNDFEGTDDQEDQELEQVDEDDKSPNLDASGDHDARMKAALDTITWNWPETTDIAEIILREDWPQGRHRVPSNGDWELLTLEHFAKLSSMLPDDRVSASKRLETFWHARRKNHGGRTRGRTQADQEANLRKDIQRVCLEIWKEKAKTKENSKKRGEEIDDDDAEGGGVSVERDHGFIAAARRAKAVRTYRDALLKKIHANWQDGGLLNVEDAIPYNISKNFKHPKKATEWNTVVLQQLARIAEEMAKGVISESEVRDELVAEYTRRTVQADQSGETLELDGKDTGPVLDQIERNRKENNAKKRAADGIQSSSSKKARTARNSMALNDGQELPEESGENNQDDIEDEPVVDSEEMVRTIEEYWGITIREVVPQGKLQFPNKPPERWDLDGTFLRELYDLCRVSRNRHSEIQEYMLNNIPLRKGTYLAKSDVKAARQKLKEEDEKRRRNKQKGDEIGKTQEDTQQDETSTDNPDSRAGFSQRPGSFFHVQWPVMLSNTDHLIQGLLKTYETWEKQNRSQRQPIRLPPSDPSQPDPRRPIPITPTPTPPKTANTRPTLQDLLACPSPSSRQNIPFGSQGHRALTALQERLRLADNAHREAEWQVQRLIVQRTRARNYLSGVEPTEIDEALAEAHVVMTDRERDVLRLRGEIYILLRGANTADETDKMDES